MDEEQRGGLILTLSYFRSWIPSKRAVCTLENHLTSLLHVSVSSYNMN